MDLNKHFQTMRAVALKPKDFFEGMNLTEGYGKPTIFLVINTILTLIVSVLFSFLLTLKAQNLLLSLVGLIVLIPVMLIVLFVVTAILHVIAKVLGGKGKYVNSYQAISYATAISPATAVPILGILVSFYQLYIVILGFKKVHQYSLGKAIITILLPAIVSFILTVAVITIVGLTAFNFLKNSGMQPGDLKNLQNLQNVQNTEDLKNLYPTFAPQSGSDYPTGYPDYEDTNTLEQ